MNIRKVFNYTLIIVSVLIVAYLIRYNIRIIFWEYQMERLEGAVVDITNQFAAGHNPYNIYDGPLHAYVYSFMYNLAVLPFTKLFASTLVAHRFVTFVFNVLSVIFLIGFMYKSRVQIQYIFAGTALFFSTFIFYVLPIARPDSMALFFFLISVLTPAWLNYSKKSLLISVIAVTVAFFTKQYLGVGVVIVTLYLFLFVSKKKALTYVFLFLGVFLPVCLVIQLLSPYYFFLTFLWHLSNSHYHYTYFLQQTYDFFIFHSPGFLLIIILCSLTWIVRHREKIIKGVTWIYENEPEFKLDLSYTEKPVLETKIGMVCFAAFCGFLLHIYPFGGNGGNYLIYTFQLFVPFFYLFVFSKLNFPKAYLLVPFILLNLYSAYVFKGGMSVKPWELNEWRKTEQYVQSNEKILNSPVISLLMQKHGRKIYDTGQTGNGITASENHNSPTSKKIYSKYMDYVNDVNQKIRTGYFDLIILERDTNWLAPYSLMCEKYQISDSLKIYMPHVGSRFVLNVWKRKA
jgi:hypothetical protein